MKNAISVKYTLLCGTACCMASAVQAQRNVSDVSRMNVLFLMADDMRPELGCYGVEAVKTPNMDRLASSGVLFQNAYCNVPVSGASRASLLTGVYPHYPDRFVNFSAYASKDCPEAIPLSGWFKEWLSYSFGWQSFSPHERSCRIVERTSLPESSGWIRCLLGGI